MITERKYSLYISLGYKMLSFRGHSYLLKTDEYLIVPSFLKALNQSTIRNVNKIIIHVLSVYTNRLEVCIVSISVLEISVGELSVLVVVWDPSKGGVVIVAGVEDFVHYLLRLLSAHLPHCQDGTQGASSDTLLLVLLQAKVES